MTGHTPKPWRLESEINPDGSDLYVVDGVRGYVIARCADRNGLPEVNEAKANARLIAAAPDLYDSLKECLRIISRHVNAYGHRKSCDSIAVESRARIALARVEDREMNG